MRVTNSFTLESMHIGFQNTPAHGTALPPLYLEVKSNNGFTAWVRKPDAKGSIVNRLRTQPNVTVKSTSEGSRILLNAKDWTAAQRELKKFALYGKWGVQFHNAFTFACGKQKLQVIQDLTWPEQPKYAGVMLLWNKGTREAMQAFIEQLRAATNMCNGVNTCFVEGGVNIRITLKRKGVNLDHLQALMRLYPA